MIALDEDALICDFAEFYHIYNIYDYPVDYIATLAIGLRDNSRIKTKLYGLRIDLTSLFLAHIVDNTAIIAYLNSKEGLTGKNRPKSMVEIFFNDKKKNEEAQEFNSGEEFDKEWRRLNGN